MERTQREEMLAALDRVMRLLRRNPSGERGEGHRHGGRGAHRVLHMLQTGGEVSTRVLAERLDIRPSSLNERLVRLEQEGLIVRRRDPQDQRTFLVALLPEGEAHLQEMKAHRAAREARLEGILDADEMAQLTALVQKLADGLEADGREDAR